MIEVRVPDEQEGTKAVVRAWLKQVGDAIAENDPLVELETDKLTQEVPAPAAGVLGTERLLHWSQPAFAQLPIEGEVLLAEHSPCCVCGCRKAHGQISALM